MRRFILATAVTLAIFFGLAGSASAQGSGAGSGDESTTSSTTATTVFVGGTDTERSLASTGADTWLLITSAGVATAGAVVVRRLLRNQAS